MSSVPPVAGYCPMGCGRTLFLGTGGHVTCSWIYCPNPAAVDMALHGENDGAVLPPRRVAA